MTYSIKLWNLKIFKIEKGTYSYQIIATSTIRQLEGLFVFNLTTSKL